MNRPRLIEFRNGVFARRGERQVVDGITWLFVDGEFVQWTSDAVLFGCRDTPEHLWSAPLTGEPIVQRFPPGFLKGSAP